MEVSDNFHIESLVTGIPVPVKKNLVPVRKITLVFQTEANPYNN